MAVTFEQLTWLYRTIGPDLSSGGTQWLSDVENAVQEVVTQSGIDNLFEDTGNEELLSCVADGVRGQWQEEWRALAEAFAGFRDAARTLRTCLLELRRVHDSTYPGRSRPWTLAHRDELVYSLSALDAAAVALFSFGRDMAERVITLSRLFVEHTNDDGDVETRLHADHGVRSLHGLLVARQLHEETDNPFTAPIRAAVQFSQGLTAGFEPAGSFQEAGENRNRNDGQSRNTNRPGHDDRNRTVWELVKKRPKQERYTRYFLRHVPDDPAANRLVLCPPSESVNARDLMAGATHEGMLGLPHKGRPGAPGPVVVYGCPQDAQGYLVAEVHKFSGRDVTFTAGPPPAGTEHHDGADLQPVTGPPAPDRFADVPSEVAQHVLGHLDADSRGNLAAASRAMRDEVTAANLARVFPGLGRLSAEEFAGRYPPGTAVGKALSDVAHLHLSFLDAVRTFRRSPHQENLRMITWVWTGLLSDLPPDLLERFAGNMRDWGEISAWIVDWLRKHERSATPENIRVLEDAWARFQPKFPDRVRREFDRDAAVALCKGAVATMFDEVEAAVFDDLKERFLPAVVAGR